MKPWRTVIEKEWQPSAWALGLECGHVAYRSGRYSHRELPDKVLCEACQSLIGSQVKTPQGGFGTIASFKDGLFDVAWNDDGRTRWTLDELRTEAEIL